jgi:hypothetical protein
MKTGMSRLLLTMLVAASVLAPAAAGARERGVNERQYHQRERIEQGARQGDLTSAERRELRREARHIRRDEREARSDGRYTRAERREVHRDLDRLSRDIRRERHDDERRHARGPRDFGAGHGYGYGHGGWQRGNAYGHQRHARPDVRQPHPMWQDRSAAHYSTREFDRRVDAIQLAQRDRIARGIRSGELTRYEAQRLWAEQRAVENAERRYLADGVLTAGERRELVRDLNAADRHIYNETHDAHSRRDGFQGNGW